ncbi:hypothetical protein [Microbacterium lacticum]
MAAITRRTFALLLGCVVASALVGCFGSPDSERSAQATSAAAGVRTPLPPSEVPPIETDAPVVPSNEPGRQDSVLDSLPGEAASGCVTVGERRDVRSGTMAAGNFADARARFAADPSAPVSLYVIPVDLNGDPALTMTLTRLGGEGSTTVETAEFHTADEWRFYGVNVVVPGEGEWRIEASAGEANQGCWEVDFP